MCSSFFRLAETCWASATALAERKYGQMALGWTSCLSMAGNSSSISGVSGRTERALPAPTFSVAGCNLPGTTYGLQYLQRELDRRWLPVPTEIQGMPYSDVWQQLKCHIAKCLGVLLRGHSIVSQKSSEDIRESKVLRLCSVLFNTNTPKGFGNPGACVSNENMTLWIM